jgi:hypothetical protein
MVFPDEAGRELELSLRRVEIERDRAQRAAEIALRHERHATGDPGPMREFHAKMSAMHRRAERQHLAAARIHASHADRLRRWVAAAGSRTAPPRLLTTVAQAMGAESLAVTLFGADRTESLVAASDAAASSAQDLEFTLDEGPARDAVGGPGPIAVVGSALTERWSNYGPAVAALGIGAVAAVPVSVCGLPLGALTEFGRADSPRRIAMEPLLAAADALALSLVSEQDAGDPDSRGAADLTALFGEADRWAVVHQAAGVVSVQFGCSVKDALALIRARAFADGEPVGAIASAIMHRRLRLD